MKISNTPFIILLVAFLCSTASYSQKSTEELGEQVLGLLKSNDSIGYSKLLPKYETIIGFSDSLNIEIGQEEKDQLLNAYPDMFDSLVHIFTRFRAYAETSGVNWENAEFIETITKPRDINSNKKKLSGVLTKLSVSFNSENRSYLLIIEGVFEYKSVWFASGHLDLSKK